jgi:hypothetical protein
MMWVWVAGVGHWLAHENDRGRGRIGQGHLKDEEEVSAVDAGAIHTKYEDARTIKVIKIRI